MSQYHQGPHFPVSSSPIFPLDAQPSRDRRPSQLFLDPRFSSSDSNSVGNHVPSPLPGCEQPCELSPSGSACSVPADWVGEATPIELDVSTINLQQRHHSQPSTSTPSPYTHSNPLPSAQVGWRATPAPLNLIPYKPFPKGPEGNGTSFFYRSPTPSARQRTSQACEKCRDRKTKCSGARPTCFRCQARGLICEYASGTRVRGPSKQRKRSVPPLDAPAVTRKTTGRHLSPPRNSVNYSVWQSQVATAKASETMQTDLRKSWSMSDHSDDSNESGDAAAYARAVYLGLNSMPGACYAPSMPSYGFNDHYPYFHPQHHGTRESQFLRASTSMPQLKPGVEGGEEYLGRSSSSMYSAASLNASFVEFFSSSEESLHSRCHSPPSSPASNSHSSPDGQDVLTTGISTTTIKLDGWSADAAQDKREVNEPEDPVYRCKESNPLGDVDEATPRPLSHQFNASEWITGDYEQPSADSHQLSPPATTVN